MAKKYLLYTILGISIILNVILVIYYNKTESIKNVSPSADERRTLIETFVKEKVCENLFYPNSYDPVTTKIDSAFYGPMLDNDCLSAASDIIEFQKAYNSAQAKYNESVDMIKFHGITDLGTFHWGKDRDDSRKEMSELNDKIAAKRAKILNRDASHDGEFIGWAVTHRYRASNNQGNVLFGNVLFIINPDINELYFAFDMSDGEMQKVQKIQDIISEVLNQKEN